MIVRVTVVQRARKTSVLSLAHSKIFTSLPFHKNGEGDFSSSFKKDPIQTGFRWLTLL